MVKDNAHTAIRAELEKLMASGKVGEAEPLPSVRALARQFGASPVTVQRVVSDLAREGLVDPIPGRGTFVSRRPAATRPDTGWQLPKLPPLPPLGAAFGEFVRPPSEARFDMASGYLDERLLPTRELSTALTRAARRPGAWRTAEPAGLRELREWFAREAGVAHREHRAVVTPGSQAALAALFRTVAKPGDPVIVEAPTYLGALVAIHAAELRPVAVPTDARGMLVEHLPEALDRSAASVVYVQPTFANPHGASLAARRRPQLLEAARNAGAMIVEDDYARDLGIDGAAPPPLVRDDDDGRVIYVRSLSKAAAPSLRVAVVLASGPVGDRLHTTFAAEQLFVSRVLQEAALEFVVSAARARHLRRLAGALRERRDAGVTALRRHWPQAELGHVPRGGLHLWLRLPAGVDDVELARHVGERGVAVNAGSHWFPAEATGAHLRLSYAAAAPHELDAGIAALAETSAQS